ncbi:MAG: WbqC family protein [Thermodesulfobacteriota bacterium]
MIVSIHQPAYLPWLGYFDKIKRADLFIYLDTVQYQKNSFQNRNKIRTKSGPIWLTVPVETSGRLYTTPLKEIAIDNRRDWRAKHRRALMMHYGRSRMFDAVFPRLEPFYLRSWERLADLCWEMMVEFNRMLGIGTRIVRASELEVGEGGKSDLVLNICKATGATTYLSGSLGRHYLVLDDFAAADIEVVFQDYVHPTYTQQYPGFEPFMGIVDCLFNEPDAGKFIGERDDVM